MKNKFHNIMETYILSPTYIINSNNGSITNYKYFLYPFKNFTYTDPKDEVLLAESLSKFIPKDIDFLVTFEADGIGITKLISIIMNVPMIVCKPFHYNQKVFSFIQKTGYFSRKMYCPSLIEGKKIAIIDCIVSTGGTIKGFLSGLNNNFPDTEVAGIYSVVNKKDFNFKKNFAPIDFKYLFDISINETGKVQASLSKDLINLVK